MADRIAVVGLGRMGRAIAERLAGMGVEVTGWTRSGATSEVYSVASTLAEAVERSDIVMTSLLDAPAVRAVLRQLSALDLSDKLVVETSTVSPAVVRELEGRIKDAGGRLMDAPISGGPETVVAGTAGFYLGGAPTDVERFTPFARHLSDRVVEIGPLGAGAAAKLVNNTAMAGAFHAIIDAMQLGKAMGLTLETMLSFLKESPGTTPMFRARIPKIIGDDETIGFAIQTALTNTELFLETAESFNVALPEIEHARGRLQNAIEAELGEQDPAAIVRFVLKT